MKTRTKKETERISRENRVRARRRSGGCPPWSAALTRRQPHQRIESMLVNCRSNYDTRQWSDEYHTHLEHLRLLCRGGGEGGFVPELAAPLSVVGPTAVRT